MVLEEVHDPRIDRASESSRRQRDGSRFVGGYGQKIGSSDLRFLEGQLPMDGDRVASEEPPSQQLERCLEQLETALVAHNRTLEDVLQMTLYLTDMDSYDAVNETYERYFDDPYPARTTVGVSELLGNAAVTVDAIAAVD